MPITCAVCYEECSNEAIMPCCHNPTSTLRYCTDCIGIICESPPGRCPTCRSYIQINTVDGVVTVSERQHPCRICRQTKTIVDEQHMLCEGCLLGMRYCFNYECDSCHRVQRIPHPMWKYQHTPTTFGNDTWACQLGCQAQTHWRIIPEQAALIPPEHSPDSWGRRDEWLNAVRAQRSLRTTQRRQGNMNTTNTFTYFRPYRTYIFIAWFAAYVMSGGTTNDGIVVLNGSMQLSTVLFALGIVGLMGVRVGLL